MSIGPTPAALYLVLGLLGGCVYVPRTTAVYDEKCQSYQRQMTLEAQQVGSIMGCGGDACIHALVVMGAVSAATAVVSGSVVVIGNVVYWVEHRGRCLASPKSPSSVEPARVR